MPIQDSTTAWVAGGSLLTLVILSFLLERSLALLFDHDLFRAIPQNQKAKPVITFLLAWFVCWYYDFDVVASLLEPSGHSMVGNIMTASILSGGSAVVVQLVQQIWGFSKENREAKKQILELEATAKKAELQARIETSNVAVLEKYQDNKLSAKLQSTEADAKEQELNLRARKAELESLELEKRIRALRSDSKPRDSDDM